MLARRGTSRRRNPSNATAACTTTREMMSQAAASRSRMRACLSKDAREEARAYAVAKGGNYRGSLCLRCFDTIAMAVVGWMLRLTCSLRSGLRSAGPSARRASLGNFSHGGQTHAIATSRHRGRATININQQSNVMNAIEGHQSLSPD